MSFKFRKILGIILKFAASTFSIVGILLSYFVPWGIGYMSGIRTFLYFTIDCNLFSAITLLIGIGFDISDFIKGKETNRRTYQAFDQIFTIGMTITSLSYYGMFLSFCFSSTLAEGWSFIAFPSNWTVHLAAPLFVLLNYFLCTLPMEKEDTKLVSILALIFPILYLVGTYILSFNGVKYGEGTDLVPYFFMDYSTIKWYFLILIYIAAGFALYYLSIFMLFLKRIIFKKLSQKQ